MKRKTKSLIILAVVVFSICMFNTSKVNATSNPKVTISNNIMSGLLEVTGVRGSTDAPKFRSVDIFVDTVKLDTLLQDTTRLNSLLQSDNYIYETLRIEMPSNANKAVISEYTDLAHSILGESKQLETETISGINYAKYNMGIMKKENGEYVIKDSQTLNIQYLKDTEVVEEYDLWFAPYGVFANLDIVTESGEPLGEGGFGGYIPPPYRAQALLYSTENDYKGCYYKLLIDINAGETITLDKLGTFTFEKKQPENQGGYYIYKKKIENTTILYKPGTTTIKFKAKDISTGRQGICEVAFQVYGKDKNIYTVSDKIGDMGLAIDGTLGAGVSITAESIDKNETTYIEMKNYLMINDAIYLGAYDIKLINGNYEGALTLTFDLGKQYDGRTVYIAHKKSDKTIEKFNEVVKDGKVTIKVTELSPFMIALEKEVNSNDNENNDTTKPQEKDETPKTGTMDVIYFILPVAIISALGIVAFKKKQEN